MAETGCEAMKPAHEGVGIGLDRSPRLGDRRYLSYDDEPAGTYAPAGLLQVGISAS